MEILQPRTATGRLLGIEPNGLDTIMIVKRYLWDTNISQSLQVTIPHGFLDRFLQQFGRAPTAVRPANEPADAQGWLRCALILLDSQEESRVVRSIRYLQDLAAGRRGNNVNFPPLTWLHQCAGDPELSMTLRRPCNLPVLLVPGMETNEHLVIGCALTNLAFWTKRQCSASR